MVKIAVVGAGGISERHIGAIMTFENAEIVGVIDINRKSAENRAKMCGAKVYEKLADCLDQVDMVFVLTPPSTHREIAVEAMRAGKHVVIEKPVSSTIEDAEIMWAEAQKNKVKMMVAFNMRFRVGYQRLRDFVQSGKIGTLTTYWCQRQGLRVDPKNKWSTDPMLMTGMSIQSLSHDIDALRWIAGEVKDVRAVVQESRPNLPGFDDNANVVFRLANGASANFQSSWSSHLSFNSRGVLGTNGTAYVTGRDLWCFDTFHWKTSDMKYEQVEVIDDMHDIRSFIAEDRYFIDCVEHDIQPSVTGEDGLKALQVSYAILKSSRTNQVVEL